MAARLTWQEYIREHVGSASPRPGSQVQTWSWRFSPRTFLHCSAYILLCVAGREAGKRKRKRLRSSPGEGRWESSSEASDVCCHPFLPDFE